MLYNSNSFRESSIHSKISYIAYNDRIWILANCSTWTKQLENSELQSSGPVLFYGIREETNNTNIVVMTTYHNDKRLHKQ